MPCRPVPPTESPKQQLYRVDEPQALTPMYFNVLVSKDEVGCLYLLSNDVISHLIPHLSSLISSVMPSVSLDINIDINKSRHPPTTEPHPCASGLTRPAARCSLLAAHRCCFENSEGIPCAPKDERWRKESVAVACTSLPTGFPIRLSSSHAKESSTDIGRCTVV